MPVYATLFVLITLSSIGLPLMNGFIGEFLVLSGAFRARALYGVLGATGVIRSAAYMLWMVQRVFYGENRNPKNAALPDAVVRERLALWPTVLAALIMGVAPQFWLAAIDPAAGSAVAPLVQTAAQVVAR